MLPYQESGPLQLVGHDLHGAAHFQALLRARLHRQPDQYRPLPPGLHARLGSDGRRRRDQRRHQRVGRQRI